MELNYILRFCILRPPLGVFCLLGGRNVTCAGAGNLFAVCHILPIVCRYVNLAHPFMCSVCVPGRSVALRCTITKLVLVRAINCSAGALTCCFVQSIKLHFTFCRPAPHLALAPLAPALLLILIVVVLLRAPAECSCPTAVDVRTCSRTGRSWLSSTGSRRKCRWGK